METIILFIKVGPRNQDYITVHCRAHSRPQRDQVLAGISLIQVSVICRPLYQQSAGCRGLSDHVFAAWCWPCAGGFDRHCTVASNATSLSRRLRLSHTDTEFYSVRALMAVVSDYSCDFLRFNYF